MIILEDELVLSGNREEHLEILRELRPIDDAFMTKVFEDKECAQLLLRVILNRDDLTVEKAITQWDIKNLQGRSTRLDIYAVDSAGKHYDVEVQRENKGAEPKRARFNGSLMDANALTAGQEVSELPEVYVVFITEKDLFKAKKPIYTIDRTIAELGGALFGDGSHIIYVNGEIRDKTKLGQLMQDMFCSDPKAMNNEVLSDRTKYFKETKEGVDIMCKLMEDYGQKREARGEARGAEKKSKEIARNIWNSGIRDVRKIADLTNLPVDEIKKLLEGETA